MALPKRTQTVIGENGRKEVHTSSIARTISQNTNPRKGGKNQRKANAANNSLHDRYLQLYSMPKGTTHCNYCIIIIDLTASMRLGNSYWLDFSNASVLLVTGLHEERFEFCISRAI